MNSKTNGPVDSTVRLSGEWQIQLDNLKSWASQLSEVFISILNCMLRLQWILVSLVLALILT
jgi:hypothetical protein